MYIRTLQTKRLKIFEQKLADTR